MKHFSLKNLSLLFSVFLASCNFCEKAIKFQKQIDVLSYHINEAASSPLNVANTCEVLKENGFKVLKKASQYLEEAAYDEFYYTSNQCVEGYWTRRCNWYPNPPFPPYRSCYDYYVCVRYQTITKKLPGFEESLEISKLLKQVLSFTIQACETSKNGDNDKATLIFSSANAILKGVYKDQTTQLMSKAMCYAQ
jgi:hypothetical protein